MEHVCDECVSLQTDEMKITGNRRPPLKSLPCGQSPGDRAMPVSGLSLEDRAQYG